MCSERTFDNLRDYTKEQTEDITMKEKYAVRIAWERFDLKRAVLVLVLVLTCCFSAIYFTARPAEAKKHAEQTTAAYKYYTAITVQQGDSLWKIAEEMLKDKLNADAFGSTRKYVKEVVELNRLKQADYLMAGQRLVIPYYTVDYKD